MQIETYYIYQRTIESITQDLRYFNEHRFRSIESCNANYYRYKRDVMRRALEEVKLGVENIEYISILRLVANYFYDSSQKDYRREELRRARTSRRSKLVRKNAAIHVWHKLYDTFKNRK
jgi:hypothetical protein